MLCKAQSMHCYSWVNFTYLGQVKTRCKTCMMTSSNGLIFRVTGHSCGEYTSPLWIPHKGQWRRALMFSLICVWVNGWVNKREAGDLRRYRAHCDVTVMEYVFCNLWNNLACWELTPVAYFTRCVACTFRIVYHKMYFSDQRHDFMYRNFFWSGHPVCWRFGASDFPASNSAFIRGRQLVSFRLQNRLHLPEHQI